MLTRVEDAAVGRVFVGVLVPDQTVEISPRFHGVLAEVKVRVGDRLAAGAVLAEIDPRPLRDDARAANAAVSAAVAMRRQAQVDIEDARRRLEDEKRAVADGLSPQQKLADAEFALKRALATAERADGEVAAARARDASARERLADTSLRSPIAGVVSVRFQDAGATVSAGQPIVRIVGDGELRLRYSIPPELAGEQQAGQVVWATIDTIATPISATIRQISPTIDSASGLIVVDAELHGDVPLRPGLAAWVRS